MHAVAGIRWLSTHWTGFAAPSADHGSWFAVIHYVPPRLNMTKFVDTLLEHEPPTGCFQAELQLSRRLRFASRCLDLRFDRLSLIWLGVFLLFAPRAFGFGLGLFFHLALTLGERVLIFSDDASLSLYVSG